MLFGPSDPRPPGAGVARGGGGGKRLLLSMVLMHTGAGCRVRGQLCLPHPISALPVLRGAPEGPVSETMSQDYVSSLATRLCWPNGGPCAPSSDLEGSRASCERLAAAAAPLVNPMANSEPARCTACVPAGPPVRCGLAAVATIAVPPCSARCGAGPSLRLAPPMRWGGGGGGGWRSPALFLRCLLSGACPAVALYGPHAGAVSPGGGGRGLAIHPLPHPPVPPMQRGVQGGVR